MKNIFLSTVALLFAVQLFSQSVVKCSIKTSVGDIELVLYKDKAPLTVANFIRYADGGLYDNSSFFRVCTPENESDREVKIEVIQGGDVDVDKCFNPINIESTHTTGILHENGTISMARDTPNSATSSFFICINDQPELDYGGKRNPDGQGFAAFGKVIRGMKVVEGIQRGENIDQNLRNPIIIYSITIN
ncbi:MAG: peptidylprolyl isomerase [Flavobacteriales bacterium]|nr:peptidylprolyl isomerase [Flavobacteriales bacterium]